MHLGRRAVGNQPTEVEHRDPVRDAHHHAHVVLDQDDRNAQRVPDLQDRLGRATGLLGVHPGNRLIEQEQVWLGAERPGDLDALLIAVRQDTDRQLELVAQLHELGDLSYPLPVPQSFARRARKAEPSGQKAGLGEVVAAQHEVLRDTLRLGQGDVLERSRDPDLGDLVRAHAAEHVVAETHLTLRGPVHP